MDIKLEDGTNVRLQKELTLKERKTLGRILDGDLPPDTIKAQELLQRPHVAVAFEALLDKYNLSDDKLIKRLAEIIKRNATVSISDKGIKSTNVTTVDANARDTIRMIWQAQGKFVDKHEIKGELTHLKDEELDGIINSGLNFILNKGKTVLNDESTDRVPRG